MGKFDIEKEVFVLGVGLNATVRVANDSLWWDFQYSTYPIKEIYDLPISIYIKGNCALPFCIHVQDSYALIFCIYDQGN